MVTAGFAWLKAAGRGGRRIISAGGASLRVIVPERFCDDGRDLSFELLPHLVHQGGVDVGGGVPQQPVCHGGDALRQHLRQHVLGDGDDRLRCSRGGGGDRGL